LAVGTLLRTRGSFCVLLWRLAQLQQCACGER